MAYILRKEKIEISDITKMKKYPCIKDSDGNTISGASIGYKFLEGISHIGLGQITPNKKNFKRTNPDEIIDDNERDQCRKYLKLFVEEEV